MYYVTPHSPNPDCPSGEPCLTINEYAQGNHFDQDNNITLIFLNGEHSLTAKDLEISNKTSLKMAASDVHAEVLILLTNTTRITVERVLVVDVSEIALFSSSKSRSACLSVANSNLMSFTTVIMIYCQLSLEGVTNAFVTDLTAHDSIIHLLSTLDNQAIAIRNSQFGFSTLNISDSLSSSQVSNTTGALSLESSSLSNSLVMVSLRTPIVYELSILNTAITSQDTVNENTGITVEVSKTSTLDTIINNCSIIGNDQGISVTAKDIGNEQGITVKNIKLSVVQSSVVGNSKSGISITTDVSSRIELNIHQCNIANTGQKDYILHSVGAVVVERNSGGNYNGITLVNITSSTIVNNYNTQVFVKNNLAETTVVTIFNCSISGGEKFFGVSLGSKSSQNTYINVTQNYIESTRRPIWIFADGHDLYFINNNVTSLQTQSKEQRFGMRVDSAGVVNVIGCRFENQDPAIYLVTSTGALIKITGTAFLNNSNAITINPYEFLSLEFSVIIRESLFQENKGTCIGLSFNVISSLVRVYHIRLNNVTFFNNSNLHPNTGIVQVDERIRLRIEDGCVFRGNQGSAVYVFDNNVTLSGTVTFENNVAFQGGAISMRSSMLVLEYVNNTETAITFANNTATDHGGAIYIDDTLVADPHTTCFYKLQGVTEDEARHSAITLVFRDNKATNGGEDIFGATPNNLCYILNQRIPSSLISKYIFKPSPGPLSVSSKHQRVCLYDSLARKQCNNSEYILYDTKRYPGEVFPIFLAVVGIDFGTVTGPVYAYLFHEGRSSLGNGESMRQVSAQNAGKRLNFSINSLTSSEVIVLTVNNTVITEIVSQDNIYLVDMQTTYVYINVTLLPCPSGYKLHNASRKCECARELTEIGIDECLIFDTVSSTTRSRNQWVRPISNSSILASKYCPFNYCRHETMSLTLSDPDQQCALNHTGMLCGACPSHLSLAIGSSRCIECSDNYGILLLIAFVAAGILLVLFVKILDLTVSIGTINGLIFYANIIWANQSTLFPPHADTSVLLQFLKTFIAWLNLDFGIETCFFQHLDGYWKTWLQFVFPAYIFFIAGLIILVSHYSTKATSLFGRNSVSVLTTLILLSYAKLLRTILVILKFTVLNYPDGMRVVWSFDGNVPYFGLKHSFLFVMAVILLLLLGLPYTFVLFFIQCLRRYSHYRLLRWVNKLLPFFDSYLGPLKNKHHYWIGLGLLTRLALLLASAISLTTIPITTELIVAIIVSLLILPVLSVYTQWQLGLLEGCFLVNLVMFSSAALFNEALGSSKDALACISLGITFILFLAIIGYHVWRRVGPMIRRKQRNGAIYRYDSIQEESPVPLNSSTLNKASTFQELNVPTL